MVAVAAEVTVVVMAEAWVVPAVEAMEAVQVIKCIIAVHNMLCLHALQPAGKLGMAAVSMHFQQQQQH